MVIDPNELQGTETFFSAESKLGFKITSEALTKYRDQLLEVQ